jgi:hypothetical protein
MFSPLLWPPDYNKYFLFYLAATKSTISMVLVQEDHILKEHIIYYLSRGLVGPKLNYSHVEKLSLGVMVSNGSITTFFFARPRSLLSSTLSNMC